MRTEARSRNGKREIVEQYAHELLEVAERTIREGYDSPIDSAHGANW